MTLKPHRIIQEVQVVLNEYQRIGTNNYQYVVICSNAIELYRNYIYRYIYIVPINGEWNGDFSPGADSPGALSESAGLGGRGWEHLAQMENDL